MTKKLKDKLEKRLRTRFKDVVFFKNPNEFTTLYIERVNPNHIGIVWGRRHKKFNKGSHYIKCAKVFFYSLPAIYGLSVIGWLDCFTNYIFKLLLLFTISQLLLGISLAVIFYSFEIWINKKSRSLLSVN